jgi:hypothetical protein
MTGTERRPSRLTHVAWRGETGGISGIGQASHRRWERRAVWALRLISGRVLNCEGGRSEEIVITREADRLVSAEAAGRGEHSGGALRKGDGEERNEEEIAG